jgi:hypothetical protein
MVIPAARSRLIQAIVPLLLYIVMMAGGAAGQVIDFESNGLHYQALTKGGVTITFAKLPPHVVYFNIMQVTVTNGSPVSWMVKPEDFTFVRSDGTSVHASNADTVIDSLLGHATKGDVVKLQLLYESSIYSMPPAYRSTAGYEHRRQAAMTTFVNAKIKAAVAASAITLVPTKLKPGESTDGAIFFENHEKMLGSGRLIVNTAGEVYQFAVFPDLNLKAR